MLLKTFKMVAARKYRKRSKTWAMKKKQNTGGGKKYNMGNEQLLHVKLLNVNTLENVCLSSIRVSNILLLTNGSRKFPVVIYQ